MFTLSVPMTMYLTGWGSSNMTIPVKLNFPSMKCQSIDAHGQRVVHLVKQILLRCSRQSWNQLMVSLLFLKSCAVPSIAKINPEYS